MSGKLFISYSSDDRPWVDRLSAALRADGWETWVDHNAITGGTKWRTSIVRGLKNCDAFLIVLSPQSVRSKNVVKELSLAEEFERRILPIQMSAAEEGSDMKYQLAGLQRIGFVDVAFEVGVGHLLAALESGEAGTVEVPAMTDGFGGSTLPGTPPPKEPMSPKKKSRPSPLLPALALLVVGAALFVYLRPPPPPPGVTAAPQEPAAAPENAPDEEAAAQESPAAKVVIQRLSVAHEVADNEPIKRKRPFKVGQKVYGFVEVQTSAPTTVQLVFSHGGSEQHRSKALNVKGKRYRTWSYMTPKAPGPWRVDVEHNGKRLKSASYVVRK